MTTIRLEGEAEVPRDVARRMVAIASSEPVWSTTSVDLGGGKSYDVEIPITLTVVLNLGEEGT